MGPSMSAAPAGRAEKSATASRDGLQQSDERRCGHVGHGFKARAHSARLGSFAALRTTALAATLPALPSNWPAVKEVPERAHRSRRTTVAAALQDSRSSARPNRLKNLHQLAHIGRPEQAIRYMRCEIGEWRLIEPRRLQHAALGQVIENQIDELDLVRAQRLAVDEPGERLLHGCAIHADQRAHEQPEAAGVFRSAPDRVRRARATLREQAFKFAQVRRRQRLVQPQLGHCDMVDGLTLKSLYRAAKPRLLRADRDSGQPDLAALPP